MMDSLSLPGPGILSTHVTWDDIQEELLKSLGFAAVLGPNRSATQIAEGQGFLSRMCLILPDWHGGAEGLPRQFLVKVASCLTMQEQSESSCGMSAFQDEEVLEMLGSYIRPFHNAEVTVYRIIEKHGDGRIPIPKMFASRMFSESNETKGFLILDYLEDLAELDSGDCIGMEELKQVLRCLARFQALTPKISEEEMKVFTVDVFKNLCQKFFQNSRSGLMSDLNSIGDGYFRPLLDDFQLCFDDLYSDKSIESLDSWNKNKGLPPILSHGDLWIANTLWNRRNGKLQLRAMIDFQTSNLNIMASDLATLVTNLRGEERRARTQEIIEIFYEYVCEETEGKPLYTLEELRLSFDKIFPVCAVEVIQGSLSFIENSKKTKGDEASDIVKNNMKMLIEDMIHYHKKQIAVRNS